MKCSACTEQAAPMGQDVCVVGAHVGDDHSAVEKHRMDLSFWYTEIQSVTSKCNHGCQIAK